MKSLPDFSKSNFDSIFLSKRWEHHTKSGGYDRLAEEFLHSSKIVHTDKSRRFPSLFEQSIFPRLFTSSRDVNHYSFMDLLTEIRVFKLARNRKTGIVHALYGEDQLNLLLTYRNRLHAALTCTFHLPFESRFMKRISDKGSIARFSKLDSAIVVSKSMITDYENWVGKDNVFFVPHGIDVSVFKPGTKNRIKSQLTSDTLKVLIVGGHGRDWDLVKKVESIHAKNRSNISYTAVVPGKKIAKKLGGRIKTFSGIKESELIGLYSNADVLFIPVNFATANNSLLESLACGTPVISTHTGGIPDYLDDSCGWMLPKGDVRSAIKLLHELARDPEKIRSKQKFAREKSLQFDWSKVANEVRKVHKVTLEKWNRDNLN